MKVESFFHKLTGTLTHLIIDNSTKRCAIIDPVLDCENGIIKNEFIENILDSVKKNNLILEYALDTHLHADHLTGAFYLAENYRVKTCISHKYINAIKEKNASNPIGYGIYVKDGDSIILGKTNIKVLETPGHTNTCVTYIIGKNIFCGDLIFAPNLGCGRCDFDNGDIDKLFVFGNKILSYPDGYKIYSGHDYPSENQNPRPFSTVKDQKEKNIYFKIKDINLFREKRKLRDQSLPLPRLFKESIAYNTTATFFHNDNFS